MHRRTAGWTAFDREHREKQDIRVEGIVDPYPSISKKASSGMMESLNNVDSGKSLLFVQSMQTRSFSSVVRPLAHVEFPLLKTRTKNETSNTHVDVNQQTDTINITANPVQVLKNVHIWADQYLIEDILAAVNNDVGQASILLNEMASSETRFKNVQFGPSVMCSSTPVSNWEEDMDVFLERDSSFTDKSMTENSCKGVRIEELRVPAEPEWEEDDVYLSHRKDALKIMRIASQHSRMASNAYLRGDHLSARQLSSRSQKERLIAERLNTQAAKEILRFRNSDNDIWKLDLHGLHTTEAVRALAQHLERLESKIDQVAKLELIDVSQSFGSIGGSKSNRYAKGGIVPHQRRTLLHVITGTGNHSKGQAALPTAIKTFLSEEGYRFDDARPGVIAVRPKFRLH